MHSGSVDANVLPRPGDILGDRYLIERIVGFGSMSVVFGARHRVTGKRCAIKLLLPDDQGAASSRASAGARKLVGHFQHPNMLEVQDVGQAAGTFYTVLDWMDGESLDARLSRVGSLSLVDVRELLIPCMRGMHEAHTAGIVHSDLSPNSIYICSATSRSPEIAKVLDFGVAVFQDADAALQAARKCLPGSRDDALVYHSPEQRLGLPADRRSDVYAFGAIVYQALSGQPPRAAYTHDGRPVFFEPPPLRACAPAVSAAGTVARRAMASELSDRFQSLAELADALEACCKPRPRLPASSPAATARRSTPPPAASTTATRRVPSAAHVSHVSQVSTLSDAVAAAPSSPRAPRRWLYVAAAAGALGGIAAWWAEPEDSDVIASFEAVASTVPGKPAASPPPPSAAAVPAAPSALPPAVPAVLPTGSPPAAAAASESDAPRPIVHLPLKPPSVRQRSAQPTRTPIERRVERPAPRPRTAVSADDMEMQLF